MVLPWSGLIAQAVLSMGGESPEDWSQVHSNARRNNTYLSQCCRRQSKSYYINGIRINHTRVCRGTEGLGRGLADAYSAPNHKVPGQTDSSQLTPTLPPPWSQSVCCKAAPTCPPKCPLTVQGLYFQITLTKHSVSPTAHTSHPFKFAGPLLLPIGPEQAVSIVWIKPLPVTRKPCGQVNDGCRIHPFAVLLRHNIRKCIADQLAIPQTVWGHLNFCVRGARRFVHGGVGCLRLKLSRVGQLGAHQRFSF